MATSVSKIYNTHYFQFQCYSNNIIRSVANRVKPLRTIPFQLDADDFRSREPMSASTRGHTHRDTRIYVDHCQSCCAHPLPLTTTNVYSVEGSRHTMRASSTNGESKRIANRRRLTTLNNFTSRDFVNRRIHSVYVYLCSINHERSSSRNNR